MTTPFEIGYSDATDAAAVRERLILDHLPQVRWIAARVHEKLPPTFAMEDLISTGIVGLINAIDSFDPAHNAQLKTYAEYKIRGAILDSIRGLDGFPAHRRKDLKRLEESIARLEQQLERAPTEEEIAADLKISLSEYHSWLYELRSISIGSLDAPANGRDGAAVLHYIADTTSDDPVQQIEKAALEKLITEGLATLPQPERLVLTLYYKEGQNMREIAPILDLHLTRIAQLKSQGILRLRSYLAKRWPSGRRGI